MIEIYNKIIPLWEIATVLVCFFFSAFFSSAETALTSLTRERTLQILEDKSSNNTLKYWIENPNKILTVILIGNNLANILATALMTIIANTLFIDQGISVAVGVMTFLILIFGEIIPKTIARTSAPKYAEFAMKFLIAMYYIFYPVTWSFVNFAQIFAKLAGVKMPKHLSMVSQKDLDFLINLANKEGKLIGSKGEYLKAVSEFDDLKVRNIMVSINQVQAIEINITMQKLLEVIQQHMHTRYPVYQDNFENFVGLLHVKDLLLKFNECEEANSIVSVLRPIYWTNEYMKINDVLQMMKNNKSQLALIRDEFNNFSGIITMEDILEELVGDIADEHDEDEDQITLEDSGIYEVEGSTLIHDLNEKFNMDIPEDKDYQTINGFLLSQFNGIPPQKDTVILWKEFEIKIIELKNNSIQKIEIQTRNKSKSTPKK